MSKQVRSQYLDDLWLVLEVIYMRSPAEFDW